LYGELFPPARLKEAIASIQTGKTGQAQMTATPNDFNGRGGGAARLRGRTAAHDSRDLLTRTSVFFLLSFWASALLALPYLSIH
jgi:hypothetical protein